MEIKLRHRKIIAKKLENQSRSYELERIKHLPKNIKLHFHFTDGFSNRVYYYKIKLNNTDNKISLLYCKLSPIILLLFFNVTFWTVGDKWMERYRIN